MTDSRRTKSSRSHRAFTSCSVSRRYRDQEQ